MSVLSLTALSRVAERTVRSAGGEPVLVDDVLAQLVALDVDLERAQAGIRLAVTVGRLEAVEDNGRQYLRLPSIARTAA